MRIVCARCKNKVTVVTRDAKQCHIIPNKESVSVVYHVCGHCGAAGHARTESVITGGLFFGVDYQDIAEIEKPTEQQSLC